MDSYERYRVPLYRGIRNFTERLDKYESCDWQCVQGCYDSNVTGPLYSDDDNNDECFKECGCYDTFIRYVAKRIESKASNISRQAGKVARSPSPLSLASYNVYVFKYLPAQNSNLYYIYRLIIHSIMEQLMFR